MGPDRSSERTELSLHTRRVSGRRLLTWLADRAGECVAEILGLADDLESSLCVEVDVRLCRGFEITRHPGSISAGSVSSTSADPRAEAVWDDEGEGKVCWHQALVPWRNGSLRGILEMSHRQRF